MTSSFDRTRPFTRIKAETTETLVFEETPEETIRKIAKSMKKFTSLDIVEKSGLARNTAMPYLKKMMRDGELQGKKVMIKRKGWRETHAGWLFSYIGN